MSENLDVYIGLQVGVKDDVWAGFASVVHHHLESSYFNPHAERHDWSEPGSAGCE